MLFWLIIAVGFVACLVIWNFWQGITIGESAILFVMFSMILSMNLRDIYREATTDHYLISGYVTSLIHRSAFDYPCGSKNKHTCHAPERWIIEQEFHPPRWVQQIQRAIYLDKYGTEECFGECNTYYAIDPKEVCCERSIPIMVDAEKLQRTKLGDPSAVWNSYFNPVQISDTVVYNSGDNDIPYFTSDDYNIAHRLIAPSVTKHDERKLEELNAAFSLNAISANMSIGLIITPDNLYFEKLRRAWHQGKANDFVVVINSPDEKSIKNVNILGWYNYAVKESVAKAIMELHSVNIDHILSAINDNLQGQQFTIADFSKYSFLDIKIPSKYYWKIFIFQIAFLSYMLTLLRLNPNTKNKKLTSKEIGLMWEKSFEPPHWNWHLHPLTKLGIVLYFFAPVIVAGFLFG